MRLGLSTGILNNLSDKKTGLIYGTYRQHDDLMSEYAVSSGGFGGIMALMRSQELSKGDILKETGLWVKRALPTLQKFVDINAQAGLYDGMAGICSVLYDLGYKEEALNMLTKLNIDSEATDYTLYSGLSGEGLVFLSFYTMTNNKDFLNKALKIANIILSFSSKNEPMIKMTNGGLLNGWSGVALFLSILGEYSQNDTYKKAGANH